MAKKKDCIFLSYPQTDRGTASHIAEVLRGKGFEVDLNDRKLNLQMDGFPELKKAIRRSKFMVILVSPDFLTSQWCNFEAGVAIGESLEHPEKHVLTVLLRGVKRSEVPALLRPSRALDATEMNDDELADRLGEIIAAFQAPPGRSGAGKAGPSAKVKDGAKKVGF